MIGINKKEFEEKKQIFKKDYEIIDRLNNLAWENYLVKETIEILQDKK